MSIAQRLPTALTEGRGTITTTAVFLHIDPDRLATMLPRGLALADADGLAFVLLSRNHFSSWFGDMRYHELIFAIANVDAGAGLRGSYMRRLYLDEALPRRLGNLIYGFEKLPATIRWDGLADDRRGLDGLAERYHIGLEDRHRQPLLAAEFEPTTSPASVTGLARMWAILDQPILSQAARRRHVDAALDRGGPFLRSEIRYGSRDAITRPVAGHLGFGAGFDPQAMADLRFDVEPLDAAGLGALAWHTDQTVTLPTFARTSTGP